MITQRSYDKKRNLNLQKSTVIISLTELKKIKRNLSIFSEPSQSPKNLKENPQSLLKRIKSYENIRNRKIYNILLTDDINNNKIREKAQRLLEENLEEVKKMNKLVLYAKVASIRDKQIEEQKKIKSLEKKRNEKMDLIYEIERLKEMRKRELEEEKKINLKIEGGKMIREQIKYNEKKKEKEKEMIKKEYEENLKLQKKLDEENEKKLLKAKQMGDRLIKDILTANKLSIENKKLKKLKEIEEENKILEYNKAKAKEEDDKIINLKKEQKKKELELMRMKQKQEKALDYKAYLEKIIMKRAYESQERAERKKEKENAMKQKKMWDDVIQQNKKLIEIQELRKVEMAEQEKKDFDTITKRIAREFEIEKIKYERYKNKLANHNLELLKLIKDKEDDKKLKKREILEEGRIIKQNNERYYNRIEQIKRKKIKELESLNINPHYLVPLKNYRSLSNDDLI